MARAPAPWLSLRLQHGVLALRDLGNDEYEVAVDGSGKEPRSYSGYLMFDAGVTGGSTAVSFSIDVSAVARFPGALGRRQL